VLSLHYLLEALLQILFRVIYRQGSRKKLIGKIGQNIGNYRKISARINLDLKNSENIGKIGNLKSSGEIRDICNTG
jgi:hypothetical protein